MLLVVDANVLFAALIKDSKTAELILSDQLKLITPEYMLSEFKKHKPEILRKTGRDSGDFEKFMWIVWNKISVIPNEEIKHLLNEANQISPDIDDAQYFALALKYDCAIWSNDSKLKEQPKIKIFATEELIKFME